MPCKGLGHPLNLRRGTRATKAKGKSRAEEGRGTLVKPEPGQLLQAAQLLALNHLDCSHVLN